MGVVRIGIAAVALDAAGTVVGYLLRGWPAVVVGLPILLAGVTVTIVLGLVTRQRVLRDPAQTRAGAVPVPGRGWAGGGPGSTTWYDDAAPPGWPGESFPYDRPAHDPDCGPVHDGWPAYDTSCDPASSFDGRSGAWSDATSSSSAGSDSSSAGSDSSSSSSW